MKKDGKEIKKLISVSCSSITLNEQLRKGPLWNFCNRYVCGSFLALFVIFSFSCNSGELKYQLRADSPVVSHKKDGTGYIYSDCNVFVKHVVLKDWKRLLSFSFYRKKKSARLVRVPGLLFFHVIIENRMKDPVIFLDAKILYGKKRKQVSRLSLKEIRNRMSSPVYRVFHIENLLKHRRFFEDDEDRYRISTIDYGSSIEMKLDFIPPYEKVLLLVAFDPVPATVRRFVLRFIFTTGEKKKVIDFDMRRFEYRTAGKYFINPDAKKNKGGI